MINRLYRFHGYNALRFVYKQGKTARLNTQAVPQPLFTLRYAPNRRKSYRLAVVVSKKQHKSAVERNRVRRRIYEAGRELIPRDATYDLVVTVTGDKILELSKKDIDNTLLQLLQISEIGKGIEREKTREP
jgi:ribonuclease P protein component